jgi:DNA (cytosine-5)-methyltransferase 1
LKYLSVCSGIEAASVAWNPLGWTPVGFSEIDPFACSVLSFRFPEVQNFGDLTQNRNWVLNGPIDILVGGTPCQSFSRSGDRKGLKNLRSQLVFCFIELASRLKPSWIVWENVPFVLSSNQGQDFEQILEALEELGYGLAWRTLDAQYVRVDGFERALPQRRRRLFLVGSLGTQGCKQVLFNRKSNQYCFSTVKKQKEVGAELGNGFKSDSTFSTWWDGNVISSTITRSLDEQFMPDKFAFNAVIHNSLVRRLTPREFERLQGFPDDWTLVHHRGRLAYDKPRYKAIGNSMAVNCIRWIGRGIETVAKV